MSLRSVVNAALLFSPAAGSPGLGMGLSIVRGICDSHAATLNFRRNPAGGVTARVVFAAADPDNSNKESSAS